MRLMKLYLHNSILIILLSFSFYTNALSTIPYDGLISYFTGDCPTTLGWSLFSSVTGRSVLLMNNSYQAGEMNAVLPLEDGQDPTHQHILQGYFQFDSKHVASVGGLNTHGAKRGPQPLIGYINLTLNGNSGYPFVQLTPCRYSSLSLQPPPILPMNTLTLWDPTTTINDCPNGTIPIINDGYGKLLVVSTTLPNLNNTYNYRNIGSTNGIEPDQEIAHAHLYNATLNIDSTDFVGIDGCCDDDPTSDNPKTITNEITDGSTSNIPRISMLSCIVNTNGNNDDNSHTETKHNEISMENFTISTPPNYVLLTMDPDGCPIGWNAIDISLSGRIIIGTPQYGIPLRTFGTNSIPFNTSWNGPMHTHDFELSIDTVSAGIGLDSGCCAHGYGASGTYITNGITSANIQLAPNNNNTNNWANEEIYPLFMVTGCVQNSSRREVYNG